MYQFEAASHETCSKAQFTERLMDQTKKRQYFTTASHNQE